MSQARRPSVGVGVVCLRGQDVLLVRRARPPLQGQWSLPGGHLEWGETLAQGALRELAEETGIAAQLLGLIDVVDALFEERHLVLVDYAARWRGGEPRAADDASEAAFFPWQEAIAKVDWSETARIIEKAVKLYVCEGLAPPDPSD